MKAIIGLVALLLSTAGAFAQSALLQGGPFSPGHSPMYIGQGSYQAIVQDSGPAGGGGVGVGLSELLLAARGTGNPPFAGQGTGQYGTNFCDYDAPTTNSTGFHFLCMSPDAQGGGLIAYGAAGGAAVLPFNFNINGSVYSFPFTVGGIVGPISSVIGDFACWNNTIGTLLKDCLPSLSQISGLGSGVATALGLSANAVGGVCLGGGSACSDYLLATPSSFSGIDPTGTTDSGPGLNLAIASACSTGRRLHIPAGNYLIATPLAGVCSGLKINGDGGSSADSGSPIATTLTLGADMVSLITQPTNTQPGVAISSRQPSDSDDREFL